MKNNKKSKIVLFSVIGLAAISIGTVGFATWITGVDSRTVSNDTIVQVDTSKNKTVIVEAALSDKTLNLREPNTSNEQQLIKVVDGGETDLTITFSSFRVIVSDAYVLSGISFSLEGTEIANCAVDEENKLSIYPTSLYDGVSNESKASYLKIGTSNIAVSSLKTMTSSDTGYVAGYKCYTLDTMSYSFSWGTMFGDGTQSPSKYLSTCTDATSANTMDEKLVYIEKCNKMLKAMNTNLDGKTIKLTIKANVTDAAA